MVFPADIAENPRIVPAIPFKHLQCMILIFIMIFSRGPGRCRRGLPGPCQRSASCLVLILWMSPRIHNGRQKGMINICLGLLLTSITGQETCLLYNCEFLLHIFDVCCWVELISRDICVNFDLVSPHLVFTPAPQFRFVKLKKKNLLFTSQTFLAARGTFFVWSILSFWWAITIWVFSIQTSQRGWSTAKNMCKIL